MKYTVSFQQTDFARRVEMALYDNERGVFIVPHLEYTQHGAPFMAGKPEDFRDFVTAVVQAWNEYCRDIRRSVVGLSELYGKDFKEGVSDGRGEDHPPDEGSEPERDDDSLRPER